MMASIAPAASMRVRSRRSTSTLVASVMIGLVMWDPFLLSPELGPTEYRTSVEGPRHREIGANSACVLRSLPATTFAAAGVLARALRRLAGSDRGRLRAGWAISSGS